MGRETSIIVVSENGIGSGGDGVGDCGGGGGDNVDEDCSEFVVTVKTGKRWW